MCGNSCSAFLKLDLCLTCILTCAMFVIHVWSGCFTDRECNILVMDCSTFVWSQICIGGRSDSISMAAVDVVLKFPRIALIFSL